MSERWAIFILFVLAIAGWGIYSGMTYTGEPDRRLLFGATLTAIVLLAWWAGADAKARGIKGLRVGESLLFLLFLPAGLGLYLARSRGLAVGLVTLVGVVFAYLAAMTAGELLGASL